MSATPIAWLRDVDGTGSLHPCAEGDAGAIPVYSDEALDAKDDEIERLRDDKVSLLGQVQNPGLPEHPAAPEEIDAERWVIACAAWCNYEPAMFLAHCEKHKHRMPEGSRAGWGRVYAAVRTHIESEKV